MQNIKTFLMMGPPGSGKGTQGKLLAQKLGGKDYSSGDRLREIAKLATPFGKKAKQVMAEGNLMPEWSSEFLFEEALVGLMQEDLIVFEGACRRLDEAKKMHEVTTWLERPYKAIYIEVSKEELMNRLMDRYKRDGRADDANPEVIQNRFTAYEQNTAPAVEYFRNEGKLIVVSGEHPIEEVHQNILKALNLS